MIGDSEHTTIQAAVDAADPGDTVIICPGDYTENVDVYKPLTIKAYLQDKIEWKEICYNPCFVYLDRTYTTVHAATSFPVFSVLADNVTIDDLRIDAHLFSSGIYLSYVNNSNIRNNIILDGNGGIDLYFADSNVVRNNTCNNHSFGIRLSSSDDNLISRNTAKGNSDDGIYLIGEWNIIEENTVESNKDGIHVFLSTSNTIEDNQLNLNERGIHVRDSDYIKINNNTIVNSTQDDGVYLSFSDNCLIEYNEITHNTETGVHLHNSTENEISNNILSYNYGEGVYLYGSHNNSVTGNFLESNLKKGIYSNHNSVGKH